MRLDKEHDILFALVRSGLWETEGIRHRESPLSLASWKKIFALARMQTVTGIAYRGLHYLPTTLLPPEEILCRWIADVERIERTNRKMNQVIHSLFEMWESDGLHPILLKGQGVAQMYEYPLLREAGDIDLCFPSPEEFRYAERWANKQDLYPTHKPDGSVSFFIGGIEIELHPELVGADHLSVKSHTGVLERDTIFSKQLLADGHTQVLIPAQVRNLLSLNTHILKHAIGKGIGLRQLCDMARAYHTYTDMDGNELKDLYKRYGISRWSQLLHSFLVERLGMPVTDLPYEERLVSSESLLRIIVRGGNFGQYPNWEKRPDSPAWRRKADTAGSFLRNAWFSLRYAPGKSLKIMTTLLKGQFK